MSNVLIGIIGVILFIGLALAGALFLGPRFQESTINSKAAASVQAIKQTADAIALKELSEGIVLPASASIQTEIVTPGYLKSIPSNPTSGGGIYLIDNGGGNSGRTAYVVLPIAVDGRERAICASIVKQTGMTTDGTIPDGANAAPTYPVGCTYNGGTNYTAFVRVR